MASREPLPEGACSRQLVGGGASKASPPPPRGCCRPLSLGWAQWSDGCICRARWHATFLEPYTYGLTLHLKEYEAMLMAECCHRVCG